MAHVIVERTFQTPISQQELGAVGRRIAECLELYQVNWIQSFLSPDRRRMICEYEASDAESVRMVQQGAEAHYDRVWIADLIDPGHTG